METKTYSFIDKSIWGDGQWQNEPDKIQWQDEETGLPCLAVRHTSSGHWCGYVGVDEGHPLFNIGYSYGDNSPDSTLEVHGGITFSDFCQEDGKEHGICHIPAPGEPDRVWWFGWDCAHAWDMSPGHHSYFAGLNLGRQDAYRTLEYVKSQRHELARQLKAFTVSPSESVHRDD